MSDEQILTDINDFLLNAPLYAAFKVIKYNVPLNVLYKRKEHTLDGFCPFCHQHSTFTVSGQHVPQGTPWEKIEERQSFDEINLHCTRKQHSIKIFILMNRLVVMKVGQFPSLADIANDEGKKYKSVLSRQDSNELHKAIGLAAHGVGIGSFVYLRRIFERLIQERFNSVKDANNWDASEFKKLRMNEKVAFLKDHLPSFLVDNHKIYSILSVGVHELEEAECLAYFEVLKQSSVIILEEDKKNKEDAERRTAFTKAIAGFGSEAKKDS